MLNNAIRENRERRGWSQQELADRGSISRSEVSAIENRRLKPSAEAAIRLARAFQCRVEDLFWEGVSRGDAPEWAWGEGASRYWSARVPAGLRRFPVETLAIGELVGDEALEREAPEATLVLATCDPAVGLLARELGRQGIRCLPLTRSSGEALELLGQGLVHVAAIHIGSDSETNRRELEKRLGPGYTSVHLACWEEGLVCSPSIGRPRLNSRSLIRHRWIGRPVGSGARICSDELLGHPAKFPDGYTIHARDHRGVAEAIRLGLADVGVCVRLAAEEAGLGFYSIRSESIDLCMRVEDLESRPMRILLMAIRSKGFQAELATLPGYNGTRCGELIG